MIKISKLADYATVIMNFLSARSTEYLSASVIAEQIHVAIPTVSKILKLLNEAGLLTSTRGIHGGYRLARPPELINVAQVIEAIDGRTGMTDCCRAKDLCGNDGVCDLRGNWQYISQIINDFLANVSLVDMGKPLQNMSVLQKMAEQK
jgi:FeS assembly SUF system regulator